MAPKASRPPLSRDRVLAAAVDLVDTAGLPALTMRRLAAELGVEAMSLYHHLPAKAALLDGVVETVLAELDDAVRHADAAWQAAAGESPAGDWAARLRAQFLAARRVMLRHPWMPGLLGTRQAVPPTVYAYYDRIVGILSGAGFSYRLAHRALHTFGSFPLGFAQEIFSPTGPDAATGAATGPDAAAAAEAERAELEAMAEALPHLTAMLASEIHAADDPTLGWCDSQTEFEFTVDLLLSGLDRLRG